MTFVYSDITAREIHGLTLLLEMYVNAMADVMATTALGILPRGHSYQSVKLTTIHQSTCEIAKFIANLDMSYLT
jgi:hypothetical protein